MRHPDSGGSEWGDAEIRGVLQFDRGCLYVALDEVQERYPIVWPAGTTWDADAEAVVTRSGGRLAIGDDVSGGGGYVGVERLEDVIGRTATAVARECVDNTFGEIAVLDDATLAVTAP